MKRIFLFLLLFISLASSAQVRISELPEHTTNPNNGWLPLTISGQTRKFNAGNFLWNGGSYSNPSWLISLAPNKLLQAGATPGQGLIWNGTSWSPGQITATVGTLPFQNLTGTPYNNNALREALDSMVRRNNLRWDSILNRPANFSTTYALSNDVRDSLTARYTKAQADARFLQSFTETDPTVANHIKAISTTNISNWDAAFGWGNHAGLYRPISYVPGWTEITGRPTALSAFSNDLNFINQSQARTSISLTTTGTGGAASYNSSTGVFNIPVYQTQLGYTAENVANKGVANGYADLDASGKVPASRIDFGQTGQTFVVASQAEMLAVSGANIGALAVRTDQNRNYRLIAQPASNLSHWILLLSPDAPVQSVNGQTGNVNLLTTNISEGSNLYFTNARAVSALTGQNISIFNNNSGYITGINSSMVITALGFTPYNASNPSGFITSAALSPYALLSGATFTGNINIFNGANGEILLGNNPAFRGRIYYDGSVNGQFIFDNTYNDALAGSGFIFRTRTAGTPISALLIEGNGSGTIWNNWRVGGNLQVDGTSLFIGASTFSSSVTATQFNGSGAGLTGTASSLSIGGNAATVTNGVYTNGSYANPAWITSLAWGKITDAPSFITGNQTITLSGDATGSGATSISVTLANSGVTAGTYTKVSVDAKGRVTSGTTLASADLPTYTGPITSSQVTTALGFTPYNASNPSGFITSAALSPYALLSGATFTGNINIFNGANGEILLGNNPAFRGRIYYDGSVNGQFIFDNTYNDALAGSGFIFRTRTAGTPVDALLIGGNGASTFSSSVTASAFFESSDIRQKKVHTTLVSKDGIDAIQYTFLPDGKSKWGYSAQQVKNIVPFAVTEGSDGFLKVDYTTIHTFKIASLEKRIAELEKQLNK